MYELAHASLQTGPIDELGVLHNAQLIAQGQVHNCVRALKRLAECIRALNRPERAATWPNRAPTNPPPPRMASVGGAFELGSLFIVKTCSALPQLKKSSSTTDGHRWTRIPRGV